jgi:hypothetical protein
MEITTAKQTSTNHSFPIDFRPEATATCIDSRERGDVPIPLRFTPRLMERSLVYKRNIMRKSINMVTTFLKAMFDYIVESVFYVLGVILTLIVLLFLMSLDG